MSLLPAMIVMTPVTGLRILYLLTIHIPQAGIPQQDLLMLPHHPVQTTMDTLITGLNILIITGMDITGLDIPTTMATGITGPGINRLGFQCCSK